jgi:hypothetical protein
MFRIREGNIIIFSLSFFSNVFFLTHYLRVANGGEKQGQTACSDLKNRSKYVNLKKILTNVQLEFRTKTVMQLPLKFNVCLKGKKIVLNLTVHKYDNTHACTWIGY